MVSVSIMCKEALVGHQRWCWCCSFGTYWLFPCGDMYSSKCGQALLKASTQKYNSKNPGWWVSLLLLLTRSLSRVLRLWPCIYSTGDASATPGLRWLPTWLGTGLSWGNMVGVTEKWELMTPAAAFLMCKKQGQLCSQEERGKELKPPIARLGNVGGFGQRLGRTPHASSSLSVAGSVVLVQASCSKRTRLHWLLSLS